MANIFSSIFGGGGSTTTVSVPAKTETEKQVDELTLQQLLRQAGLEELYEPIIKGYISDLKDEQAVRGGGEASTPEQTKKFQDIIAREAGTATRADRMAEISSELAEMQLETAKRGGAATPEQIGLIDQATSAAQATGEANIDRFRTETLRRINEEVASASGLRPTDTPIVRLSERAGEESARQQGILTSNLAGANASARLNFPLAAASMTSAIAGSQQQIDQAAESFSATLTQRAQDNRYRLFAANPVNQFAVSSLGFGSALAGQRAAASGRTVENELGLMDYAKAAGGVGQLIGGSGQLFSDRRLKRDIYHIGAFPSGVPLYIFRFHGFDDWHVGVMADEVLDFIPQAVSEHESGYLQVNYSLLH